MEASYLANVRRVRAGSPVLYRREYAAELVVAHQGKEQRFPLEFTLERDPISRWKIHLGELDTACKVGHDKLISLISEMERDRELP